ncbi:MAG: hypothetical protein ACRCW4_14185 [Candidatus Neomicrothrix subdominans]
MGETARFEIDGRKFQAQAWPGEPTIMIEDVQFGGRLYQFVQRGDTETLVHSGDRVVLCGGETMLLVDGVRVDDAADVPWSTWEIADLRALMLELAA